MHEAAPGLCHLDAEQGQRVRDTGQLKADLVGRVVNRAEVKRALERGV